MCRHLEEKIEASSHPLKEEMVLCLMTMVKDKDDTSSGPYEEWTDLVDWGSISREHSLVFLVSGRRAVSFTAISFERHRQKTKVYRVS